MMRSLPVFRKQARAIGAGELPKRMIGALALLVALIYAARLKQTAGRPTARNGRRS
jgi:hypothetical protein